MLFLPLIDSRRRQWQQTHSWASSARNTSPSSATHQRQPSTAERLLDQLRGPAPFEEKSTFPDRRRSIPGAV